jgi:lysophospholipid acyltransferase (LPLAT)-like uncharacterized protein
MAPRGPYFASLAARAYLSTLNITVTGKIPESGIIVLWHADLAVAMRAFAGLGIHVLLSSSRDGEIAALTATALGYRVFRGSSSRGGAAGIRALLRSARLAKVPVGMALDGPRGPKGVIKPGALWLSRELGLPLWPVGVAVRGRWQLSSWDRAILPWPYIGKAHLHLGPPCVCDDDSTRLAEAMHAAADAAGQSLTR